MKQQTGVWDCRTAWLSSSELRGMSRNVMCVCGMALASIGAANVAPQMADVSDQSIAEDQFLIIDFFANDADGTTPALSADLSTLPDGAFFNDAGNGTARLSWVTADGDAGDYPLIVTASDGESSVDQTVNISVDPLRIVVEVEHHAANTPGGGREWVEVFSPAGFSGASAHQSQPTCCESIKTGYETISPQLDYPLAFPDAGTWYVWLHGRGDSGADNSVHIGLDGNAIETGEHIAFAEGAGWVWSNDRGDDPVASLDIPAPGSHTFNIWMREDGAYIDKFLVTRDATYTPSGLEATGRPLIEPVAGDYGVRFSESLTVSLSSHTASAQIHYTLDGSEPTLQSNLYSAPFSLTDSTTVKARAFSPGLNNSAVVTRQFTRRSSSVPLHGMYEVLLEGDGSVAAPFDVQAQVTFEPPSGPDNAISVRAFYDGGTIWRARVYASETGNWSWQSTSVDDPALHDRSGAFSVVDSPLRGMLRQHPANPKRWITDDGNTFLTLADTAYKLFNPAVPAPDFEAYVADADALGVSVLRAGGCGGYAGFIEPVVLSFDGLYNRSNTCWDNGDLDRFDLDKFRSTDARLEWLLENYPQMYVQLIVLGQTDTAGADWFDISQARRERLLDYQLARWGAYPQLYFLILNDAQISADVLIPDMVREVGLYYAQNDPGQHLISSGQRRNEINIFTEPEDFAGWHSYIHAQRYSDIDGATADTFSQYPVPLYYGEDWYEQRGRPPGDPADPPYYYRRLFWSTLLSGGSPTYGSRTGVTHPYFQSGDRLYETYGTQYSTQLTGLGSIAFIPAFFAQRNIDLAAFEPDDALAREPVAAQPEGNSGPSRPQVAHRGQQEYLVYLPNAADGELSGGSPKSAESVSRLNALVNAGKVAAAELDLRNSPGVTYAVYWYRTRDGVGFDGQAVEGGDWRSLGAPWTGEDVVLHLTATEVLDEDGDGHPADTDNCPSIANPDQLDTDSDGVGDVCDDDADGDGLDAAAEASLGTDPLLVDTDGDGLDDFAEAVTYGTDPLQSNLGDVAPRGVPDGLINAGDYLVLNRLASGLLAPTPAEGILGDMNGDDSLDSGDMLLLLRTILEGNEVP